MELPRAIYNAKNLSSVRFAALFEGGAA